MNKGTELKGILGHVNKTMERELEGLERLAMPDELHDEECKKAGVELTEDYDLIKEALLELKSIKDANSNDALEKLDSMYHLCTPQHYYYKLDNCYDTIKNYILKAQEQEKVLSIITKKNIDMFELKISKKVEKYNAVAKRPFDTLTQEEFDLLKRYTKYEYE